MKEKVLRITSCIVVLSLIFLLMSVAVKVTGRKDSIIKHQAFFDQKEDFDVLFFGSSVVLNSVFPMQLWDDYGIASYNLAGHASFIPNSYWTMRNALDYTTPKLVVLDCRYMQWDQRSHDQYQYQHLSLDAFPLSKTKIETVNDLFRDDETEQAASVRLEMLFPFISYHSRWSALTKSDFVPRCNEEKGAESRIGVSVPLSNDPTPTDETMTLPAISLDYLDRFITDCQQRGIEVLLIYVPVTSDESFKKEAQSIPQIAEAYGVQYLNLWQMDFVDFNTDCYDPEPHLNPSGARKVTAVLGDYISRQYDIPNRWEDPDYAHWHEDFKDYLEYKMELFEDKQNDMAGIMTLMLDTSFDYMIQVPPEAVNDQMFVMMAQNLGIDMEQIPADGGYVLIQKDTRNMEYFQTAALENQELTTVLGTLMLEQSADGMSVVLDGSVLLRESSEAWNEHNLRLYMIDHGNEAECREFTIQ